MSHASALAFAISCEDCGLALQFERDPAQERDGGYWEIVDGLRASGWMVSDKYGTKCPGCKRKANAGLLDRPLRLSGGELQRKARSVSQ
jgi:hypothetical protein